MDRDAGRRMIDDLVNNLNQIRTQYSDMTKPANVSDYDPAKVFRLQSMIKGITDTLLGAVMMWNTLLGEDIQCVVKDGIVTVSNNGKED